MQAEVHHSEPLEWGAPETRRGSEQIGEPMGAPKRSACAPHAGVGRLRQIAGGPPSVASGAYGGKASN
jgi:hypothetical protein